MLPPGCGPVAPRWMPYENVSDWKVYPDIPVLVQYHDRGSGKTGKTGRGHGNTLRILWFVDVNVHPGWD